MIPGEIARAGFEEIRGHKLRSALTLMGIILGTLSITATLAFLEGVVGAVRQAYSDYLKDDVLLIKRRWAGNLHEETVFARSPGLRPDDARAIVDRVPGVAATAPYLDDWGMARAGRA